MTTSIHTSRNHTWSVLFCQITSTCKSRTQVYRHILAKSIYVHTGANNKLHEFQLTTHRYMQLSSTYTCQVKGTCNSQVHILVKSKVHATFNYILVKSKVHLKKSTSQVQPGIYTKAKSKTKNKKNHSKNMLEKRLKKFTFQCKLNLH